MIANSWLWSFKSQVQGLVVTWKNWKNIPSFRVQGQIWMQRDCVPCPPHPASWSQGNVPELIRVPEPSRVQDQKKCPHGVCRQKIQRQSYRFPLSPPCVTQQVGFSHLRWEEWNTTWEHKRSLKFATNENLGWGTCMNKLHGERTHGWGEERAKWISAADSRGRWQQRTRLLTPPSFTTTPSSTHFQGKEAWVSSQTRRKFVKEAKFNYESYKKQLLALNL